MTDPTTIYKLHEAPRRVWVVDLGGWLANGWSLEPIIHSPEVVTESNDSVTQALDSEQKNLTLNPEAVARVDGDNPSTPLPSSPPKRKPKLDSPTS